MNPILKNKQVKIIAECGLSHGGSLAQAKKFIRLVKKMEQILLNFKHILLKRNLLMMKNSELKFPRDLKIDLNIGSKPHFLNLNGGI